MRLKVLELELGSKTQLQVGGNLNNLFQRLKSKRSSQVQCTYCERLLSLFQMGGYYGYCTAVDDYDGDG